MDFREIDYLPYIKSDCVSCGRELRYGWTRYKTQGNFCPNCTTLCGLMVEARAKLNSKTVNESSLEDVLLILEKRYNITKQDVIDSQESISAFYEVFGLK